MFVSIVLSTVCGRAKWDKPRIMNNEKGAVFPFMNWDQEKPRGDKVNKAIKK